MLRRLLRFGVAVVGGCGVAADSLVTEQAGKSTCKLTQHADMFTLAVSLLLSSVVSDARCPLPCLVGGQIG